MITLVVANAQQCMIKNLALHFDRVPDISLISYAYNGIEAIKLVEEHQPNVILMELEMPVMNGIEASMIITHRFPYTKIVLLTNQDNRQILSLALEAGAKSLIFKNTRPKDMEQIIRLVTQGFYQFGPILGEDNRRKSFAILANNDARKILDGINEIKQNIALNQETMAKINKQRESSNTNCSLLKNLVSNRDNYRRRYLIDLAQLGNDSFFITGFIMGVFCCAIAFYILSGFSN